MEGVVDLLLSSPAVKDFFVGMGTSAAKEVGQKAGSLIVQSLTARLTKVKSGYGKKELLTVEKKLNGYLREDESTLISKNLWIQFLTFMFPEREVTLERLDPELCAYIADRIYIGLTFQSWLIEMGFRMENTRYMATIQGRRSATPFYFDVRAVYEQEYIDSVILLRVIDSRVTLPTEFINALPSICQDINDSDLAYPAIRDHDILVLVRTGGSNLAQKGATQATLRSVRGSFDSSLPRLLYLEENEFEELVLMKITSRRKFLAERLRGLKPYRS